MTFLQKCTDEFIDVLAKILSQDAAYTQRLLELPVEISSDQQNFALVGLYAKKILVQLNLTLISKSDFYADECLKAAFRSQDISNVVFCYLCWFVKKLFL